MVAKLVKEKFGNQQAIDEALHSQLHNLPVALLKLSICFFSTYEIFETILRQLYFTLCGWIKGTKCALFSIKCKGAVWKKSTVMKLICYCFVKQRIPKGDNCIFAYQHYTRLLAMNVHVRALSSMATIIYVFKRVQLLVLPYL